MNSKTLNKALAQFSTRIKQAERSEEMEVLNAFISFHTRGGGATDCFTEYSGGMCTTVCMCNGGASYGDLCPALITMNRG